MAFNNPSSRTPVSYGSATKALGYMVSMVSKAFSGEDEDEHASLLKKKKGKQENRFMLSACCCCIMILLATVIGFVWALKSMSYPGYHPPARPEWRHHDRGGRQRMHVRGRDARDVMRTRQRGVMEG